MIEGKMTLMIMKWQNCILYVEALQVRVIRPQAYKSEKAWKSLMAQKVIGRWIKCWGFIYKLIRA